MAVSESSQIRVQGLAKRQRFAMDASEKKLLPMGGKLCHFNPMNLLYREGQEANAAYRIRKGLVKIVIYLPNGRARIVRLHARGSLVGLCSLFEPQYEHTAIAVGYVEADQLPIHSLLRLRVDDPKKYCHLLENWYDELRHADTWITQFSTGSIRARVARLVNFLAEIEPGQSTREVQLLTCEEMAAVLGVTQESVSRILAEFKRDNVLRWVKCSSMHRFERDIDALLLVAQD